MTEAKTPENLSASEKDMDSNCNLQGVKKPEIQRGSGDGPYPISPQVRIGDAPFKEMISRARAD